MFDSRPSSPKDAANMAKTSAPAIRKRHGSPLLAATATGKSNPEPELDLLHHCSSQHGQGGVVRVLDADDLESHQRTTHQQARVEPHQDEERSHWIRRGEPTHIEDRQPGFAAGWNRPPGRRRQVSWLLGLLSEGPFDGQVRYSKLRAAAKTVWAPRLARSPLRRRADREQSGDAAGRRG